MFSYNKPTRLTQLVLALSALLCFDMSFAAKPTPVTRELTLMTTKVQFTIESTEESLANQIIDEAIDEFRRVESRLSEWQPDSEISNVNNRAASSPVVVSTETFRLLQAAQSISELSDGAFDISFSPLGNIWDFRTQKIPQATLIKKTLASIGYRQLTLNRELTSVSFAHADMKIGLGAIAKGYAVDRAAQIFRSNNIDNFSINAGGDLYAAGRVWEIGLRDPRNKKDLVALIPAQNAAVATSGDYERYFEIDGERYSHIIDPRSGWPAKGTISVTVLAPLAWQADALATAVFVLGPIEGMAIVEAQINVEAIIIDSAGNIHFSSGLQSL
jgi:thiamine biosynthesis lipoprotein